ncbi:MAG: P-loop NTPase [Oscillospiraceae bacterium]|nr:P-loop NTPase [Oscillospiraceae bacterium]
MANDTSAPIVVAVASGKGGVGKSSLCVNLAIALSQHGKRVLIADCDFGLGGIDVMLGVQTKYNFAHFLSGERTISEILQIGYDGVRFISGGAGLDELLHISISEISDILRALDTLTMPLDYILLDAGAGAGDRILRLAAGADKLLVVTTPEPTSVTDAYTLVKIVARRIPDLPLSLVVNRVTNRHDALGITDGFTDLIKTNLHRDDVRLLGFIAEDAEVTRSVRAQTPVMVTSPEMRYSRDVRNLARAELGLPPLPENAGFFARAYAKLQSALLGVDSPETRDEADYERLVSLNAPPERQPRRKHTLDTIEVETLAEDIENIENIEVAEFEVAVEYVERVERAEVDPDIAFAFARPVPAPVVAAPEIVAEILPEPAPEPVSVLIIEPEPEILPEEEPITESESEIVAEPEPTTVAEPVAEPEPAVDTEPTVEAEPESEQKTVGTSDFIKLVESLIRESEDEDK